MTSNHLSGWTPVTPSILAEPVQFETVDRGLCGVELVDGRGLLVWSSGGNTRGAVTASPEDWLVNGSVASSDAFTIAGNTSCSATCWVYRNNIYVNAYEVVGGNARSRIYKANSRTNPAAGWTGIGTAIQGVAGEVHGSSIPFIADDGTWTLVQPTSFFTGVSSDHTLRGAVSTDEGVTWTVVFNPGDNSAAEESQSRQLAAANDGTITWTYQYDVSTNLRFYNANSDLTSITSGDTSGDPPYQSAFLNNDTNVYSISRDGAYRLRVADGIPFTDWTDTGVTWHGGLLPIAIPAYVHGIIARSRVFVFAAQYVLSVPPICDPIHPQPLFIPFKERLIRLAGNLTDDGIARAIGEQFENFKAIETWAREWMTLTSSSSKCQLFIPFKDHSRREPFTSASQVFDNFKVIERWASYIEAGDCGCNCEGVTPPPSKCHLLIPFKDALTGVDMLDPTQLAVAAEQESYAFLAIERWANRYASGECGCTA